MPDLILLTGVSGFQGQWLLHTFLSRGFRVRAVLRKPVEKLQKHYESNKYVEFVIVPDLIVSGAFDNVLEGVNYIVHCASPMPQETDNYKRDVIEPAIVATQTVLDAADKTPTVKRVVITSSAGAINGQWDNMNKPGLVVTEETGFPADRNREDYPNSVVAYMHSKALALQFTKSYMEEKKRHFDAISLCPTLIQGPNFFESDKDIHRRDGDNRVLGTVLKDCYAALYLITPLATVHVRDVADAHYKALNPSVDGNQAFLITGETVAHNKVYDIAREVRPDVKFDKIADLPGEFEGKYDNSKSINVLGMKYTSFKDLLKEIIDFYF